MTRFPLTDFVIAMLSGKLPSQDPQVNAAHYGISVEHAAGFLEMQR